MLKLKDSKSAQGLIILFALLLAAPALAKKPVPKPSPKAPKGPTYDYDVFNYRLANDPGSLHPVLGNGYYFSLVAPYLFDSLLVQDENTHAWLPALAEKWKVSKDGKTTTFTLRKGAKWHDGRPVSAFDVKFSFDVYFDQRFLESQNKTYFEAIQEAKVVNEQTVQFIAKAPYFLTFNRLAKLRIIPKHYYDSENPRDSAFNKKAIGSGPYLLKEWERNQHILLEKNPDYWSTAVPTFKKLHAFKKVQFKIVFEDATALEMLKKGDLDYLELAPEDFENLSKNPSKHYKAVRVKNSGDYNLSYKFIAWNERNPLFKDKRVRQALSQLIHRDFILEKIFAGQFEKTRGPFGNSSPHSSPRVSAVSFNRLKAIELLKKAGWTQGPQGWFMRLGERELPFEFTLLYTSESAEKFLTLIQEDFKMVGIKMNLKRVAFSLMGGLMDDKQFDALQSGWNPEFDTDWKMVFHTSAIAPPGRNYMSYSNPVVDRLLDEIRVTLDPKKQIPLWQAAHEEIAEDQPYAFLFSPKYAFYGVSSKLARDADTLKYGIGIETWKPAGKNPPPQVPKKKAGKR
jgi:peptide/nickel transport system substrate-binding protein/microcin C transport system substrate-binding protein